MWPFQGKDQPFVWRNGHIVPTAVSNGEWGALQKSRIPNGSPRGLPTGKGQKEVLETGFSKKMVAYLATK